MPFSGWLNLISRVSREGLLSYKYFPENCESVMNVVSYLCTEKGEPTTESDGELKYAVIPSEV